ncbi:unnamed protein product [Microthlaspi erraticum]|uniref:DUF4283 domain-containing protein n=1 Tax=Microthlaspi erraticum TaxID=1685480 RepID=A0A6D2J5Q3_9BRAS|nr:unnamed protein product [Microthlaspi erraticum]
MWKPRGAMYVMDLPRQFFMIRFELEEEYMAALTGGPWKAFGSYLMVQAWSPDFDPLKSEIETTPVWVRLLNIPVNFYHKAILMGIAKGLGKPVRVDDTTLNFERARFARVCVEVNLKKPLKGTVLVNGERYFVSYEGLTNICSLCSLYGHLVHSCPRKAHNPSPLVVTQTTQRSVSGQGVAPVDDGFTQVRRGRRSEPEGVRQEGTKNLERSAIKEGDSSNILLANRFGNLDVNMESAGNGVVDTTNVGGSVTEASRTRGSAANKEDFGNKENMDPSRKDQGEKSGEQVNEVVFNSKSGRGLKTKRPIQKGKKVGSGKSVEMGRPKQHTLIRPTRGLIFGLVHGNEAIEMSANGKRLRVEQTSPGRSGGFVVTESSELAKNGALVEHQRAASLDDPLEKMDDSHLDEHGVLDLASEEPMEKNGA